ncbi:hypothetical protein [Spiroplasma endosymbiont of Crioceris asparagi]|uniref:hypothetical protein n=1 Tax=Spiroplasma endosymbiont of Crioceris asparagi TaxID=3066286 RepID=UPI0030D32B55
MTEKQAEVISNYLDNELTLEEMDGIFGELVSNICLYLATTMFGLEIHAIFTEGKESKTDLDVIVSKAKNTIKINKEDIKENLDTIFADEEKTETFAISCIESGVYEIELPEKLLSFLKQNDIEVDDFNIEMIISFKNEFYDFFMNEVDIEEWKNEIVETIIRNWE